MADYLPPVVAKLTGDDSSLARTLTGAKERIRRFADEAGRTRATIKVDVNLRDGALAEIRRRINDGPAARLKVDLQLGAAQREELRRSLETRPIRVAINPVLDDGARRLVEVALDHLTRARTVSIVADADTRTAADDLALLARARRARITADADTRVAADDLALLTRPRTATIRTRVVGGGSAGGLGGGERDAVDGMRALVSLAPALIPVAAEAAAVAAQVAGATLAVGAFGIAVIPQIKSLGTAAEAQKKYTDAVSKYGPTSTQAAEAQRAYAQTLDAMPPATRQAAGALMVLKSGFTSWSDGLAKFTMAPVERSMAVVQAILPKLSPMVREASTQFGRLVTVAGGAVASPGFNALAKRVTDFADRSLKGATDGTIHLIRVLSEGNSSGPLAKFMDYVHSNGPLVKDTLRNVAEAVGKIMSAAAQAGPGMLTLVNAMAKLVASLPTSFITRALQLYTAFKLITLAATGFTAVSAAVTSLIGRIVALRAASAAAGGGVAGLRAAFLSLGAAARASVVVAGIAALVLVVSKLSNIGKAAPPNVDKLTSALARLGATGQVTGEAASKFGTHFEKLKSQMDKVLNPAVSESVNNWGHSISGGLLKGGDATEALTGSFKAIDESLAGLVKGGKAKLAEIALKDLLKSMNPAQVKKLKGGLGDYKSALADQALETKLAAQSMGLFGDQAQQVQQKLDAQKASADGLRQSIQALNDVNRAGLDGMIGFEAAIDAATKAAQDNGRALHMTHGQLDLTTDKARTEAQALSDLAAKTDAATGAARDQGKSWETVNAIYTRGRSKLMAAAEAMGLTKTQAAALAAQILKTPDKTARLKMDTADARAGLEAFNAAVKRTPNAKSVTLKTLSQGAEALLESFGYKVTHLKDGSVKVSAATGQALSSISNVSGALSRLNGKVARTWTYNTVKTSHINETIYTTKGSLHSVVGATGGLYTGSSFKRGYAVGGLVNGPGTETSDDVFAPWLSKNEFVVNARSTRKHLQLLKAINDDRAQAVGLAKGGMSQGMKDARGQLSGSFGISYFGRVGGYQKTPFEHDLAAPADASSLISSLNGLSGQIKKAFSGNTESSLLKHLNSAGKSLISYEKQLNKVTASLAAAKTKLDDLKNSAAQLKSSVASSIMQGVSVVTQAPQEGFGLTSNDVVNSMNAQLQKAAAFSAQLQDLKKRGLSADLLEQLASAGVDQGGATATALAGASNAQLKQLNSMQSQLKTSANAAGSAVSDAMYGAGIKAAEGLVKGLEKKQKAIEAAMLRIAKSMEAAIKKALKIKSPSQVMAEVGDYTALGFAHGITRSSKHAVIAARGMAMSARHGAALTGTPAWAGLPQAGGGGGPGVNHYHFNFEVKGSLATVDGLAKDVERAFLQRGMRNPQTYAAYKR